MEWLVISSIAIQGVVVLAVFFMIIKEVGLPLPQMGNLKEYLSYSIPLIPFGILMWAVNASDRYLITHLLDISQTGIYTASYNLGNLITLFFFPIAYVLFPTLTKLWENKQPQRVRNYLAYSTKFYLLLAIPGAAVLFVLSQPLLMVLTRPEYIAGGELVLMISLGMLMLGIYQINVFIIHLVKQTKFMPLMVLVAATINVGLNLWLIPQIGIIAAAISTVISFFVLAVIVILWARRAVKYSVDFVFLAKVTLAAMVMSIGLMFMPVNNILGIILAVIVGVLIFAGMLIALKAFSKEDVRLIREVLKGVKPRAAAKEYPYEEINSIDK